MLLRDSLAKKTLLLLASGIDYWSNYWTFRAIRHYHYYGSWKKQSIYNALNKMLRVGDIQKVVKNGQMYLRLTSSGSARISEDIPLLKYSRNWDGLWRLVIFDIEEKAKNKRQSLRQKLVSLGFGQWQKSVYITPFALENEMLSYLISNKLLGDCFCLKASRLGGSEAIDKKIARQVFSLDELNHEYYQLYQKASLQNSKRATDTRFNPNSTSLLTQYLQLFIKDPGLPEILLPQPWWQEPLKRELNKLMFAYCKNIA
jgi:phenylacetic acid degradation operon negative regulatory protein